MRVYFWDTDGSLKEQKGLLALEGKFIPYPFTKLLLAQENFPLLEKLIPLPPSLAFLGSGDYHFLTYFHLRKFRFPFRLLLIEHHTDTQESETSLLSCGNWMNWALKLPHLKDVLVFGPEEVCHLDARMKILVPSSLNKIELRELPLYISIDKDVLAPEELKLGWEQGTWKLSELLDFLSLILSQSVNLIGADVCGEPASSPCDFSLKNQAQIKRSEAINLKIARLF
ncbi:MAG: hypothetical protein NUV70_06575 [Caldiserica bacterium]|jgi:hypothetical protein|nr:hypothetical protein [Caldisericota bacterium]